MVQKQDSELVKMPFLEAVNTDAIEGVNPKLMDILHNQFACIADAFQVQRNWTTTELRLVRNQMFQVGEAMENLNRRFDQKIDGVTENQQKMEDRLLSAILGCKDGRTKDNAGGAGPSSTPWPTSPVKNPRNTGLGTHSLVSFAPGGSETEAVAGTTSGWGFRGDMAAGDAETDPSTALVTRNGGEVGSFRRDVNDRRSDGNRPNRSFDGYRPLIVYSQSLPQIQYFTGSAKDDSTFKDWFSMMKRSIPDFNDLDDSQRWNHVASRLKGAAFKYWLGIEEYSRCTFDEAIEAMTQLYGDRSDPATCLQELTAMTIKPGQDLKECIITQMAFMRRKTPAYEMDANCGTRICAHSLFNSLPPHLKALLVRFRTEGTVEELAAAAIELNEAMQGAKEEKRKAREAGDQDELIGEVNAIAFEKRKVKNFSSGRRSPGRAVPVHRGVECHTIDRSCGTTGRPFESVASAETEVLKAMDGPLKVVMRDNTRFVQIGGKIFAANQFKTLCYTFNRCFSCGQRHRILDCPTGDKPLFPNAVASSGRPIPARNEEPVDTQELRDELPDGVYVFQQDVHGLRYISPESEDDAILEGEVAALEVLPSGPISSKEPNYGIFDLQKFRAGEGSVHLGAKPLPVIDTSLAIPVNEGGSEGTIGAALPPRRDDCQLSTPTPKSATGVLSTPCPAAVRNKEFSPQDLDPRDPIKETCYPEPVRLDAAQSRQYIQLEANGLQVMGMPDTGSTINFMSTAMYRREFSYLPLRQMKMHQAKGVTGKDKEMGVNTDGLVQLRIRYCGKVINTNFLVGEFHDSRTLILGQAWQDQMQLNVGYDLRGIRVVYMDHRVVPSYTVRGGKFTAVTSPEGLALDPSFCQPASLLESGHAVGTSLGNVPGGICSKRNTPVPLAGGRNAKVITSSAHRRTRTASDKSTLVNGRDVGTIGAASRPVRGAPAIATFEGCIAKSTHQPTLVNGRDVGTIGAASRPVRGALVIAPTGESSVKSTNGGRRGSRYFRRWRQSFPWRPKKLGGIAASALNPGGVDG